MKLAGLVMDWLIVGETACKQVSLVDTIKPLEESYHISFLSGTEDKNI